METLAYRVKMRMVKILNVLLITIPVLAAWYLHYQESIDTRLDGAVVLAVAVYILLYVTFGRVYNSFLVSQTTGFELILSQCLAFLISDFLFYGILSLTACRFLEVFPFVLIVLAQILMSILWCVCVQAWYFRAHAPKRTVVIYEGRVSIEKQINDYKLQRKFQVYHTEPLETCIQSRCKSLAGAEVVFLCGINSHDRNIILKYCVEHDVAVYLLPRIGDIIMSGAAPMHLFHLPFLRVGRYRPTPEYVLVKRIFDIVVSGTALLVFSPVMAFVAVLIKFYDGGPVFYRQTRLTKNGKEFKIIKFRSMRQDAEKDGVARLSSGEKDPRITPVGRFIRKVRIDELPQLFNILGGSMSFVGPRPERPEIAKEYEKSLPEFSLRLQAKAGLTGYAQVYGKYNTTPYDKLQMDLMYIARPSLLEDLRIMFLTIKVLFISKSVEGVSEGARTALDMRDEVKTGK